MKVLILYDSFFGHTEEVASAIAAATETHATVETWHILGTPRRFPRPLDLLIVGTPSRDGKPSEPLMNYIKAMPIGSIEGVRTATFETRPDLETGRRSILSTFRRKESAAGAVALALRNLGGEAIAPPQSFLCAPDGSSFIEGELARAGDWAISLLSGEPVSSGEAG
jgi:flavodoxin